MQIQSALFVESNTKVEKCPKPDRPEYAFIGRSNVGKSSLLNMMTGHKGLAKISSTPGKTQLINHFVINDNWYLVDLPGYGYAKASKTSRRAWTKMIERYLLTRKNLMYTFVLIDIRLEPQKIDLEKLEWFGQHQVPFILVFTKADKINSRHINSMVGNYMKTLQEQWEELPQYFISSAKDALGKEDILKLIKETNEIFPDLFKLQQ